MSSHGSFCAVRRRVLGTLGAAGAALALAPFRLGAETWSSAETKKEYPAKVINLVQRSLVIDMLAPLRLDLTSKAFTEPLSADEAAMFKASSITGFHNSTGVDGAAAYDEALTFLAAWGGFVGRNAGVFSLVDTAHDLDHAKAQDKIAVIMGLQNADQFREVKDVKAFHELGLRCAQLTYNAQNLLGSGSTERVDGGVMSGTLVHWQYDSFITRFDDKAIEPAYVNFGLDADGKVERVTMKPVSPLADFSYDYQDLLFTPASAAK